jgi:methylated-DNA-protein-cysteine methyltransferase-like protein
MVSSYEPVYQLVRQIPRGKVLTYGDVAALLGRPRHARWVGYALSKLEQPSDVPWHRVVNHRGALSTGRAWPGGDEWQRTLLEEEGVTFDIAGHIPLRAYRWRPHATDKQTC